jgi:lambda family phage portal protein
MSKNKTWWRFSEWLDGPISAISPMWAAKRKHGRFAYEVLENTRIQAKRSLTGGSGDFHLDEATLQDLRETSRDVSRNNPLAIGILRTERDAIVGDGVVVEARTDSDKWNRESERLWKEQMIEEPCDITRRYNFTDYLRMGYLADRRDGDFGTIFTDEALQAFEGEQLGTPTGVDAEGKFLKVVAGVAYSKITGAVVGYYVGEPDRWGFVTTNYKKYPAESVHLMINADRFSQSRGEPVLTQSIDYIDMLCGKNGFLKATAVAALIQACHTMFISRKSDIMTSMPDAYTGGVSSTGMDENNQRLQKVEPGLIYYGKPDESASAIGPTQPGPQFEPFVTKMLMFIGRPLCMPLALVTGDYSGATFMNMRIAYDRAQENWRSEQNKCLTPLTRRAWKWNVDRNIAAGKLNMDWLPSPDQKYRAEIVCRKWPYVDPEKEANAQKIQLENRTITRKEICAGRGRDYNDVDAQLKIEDQSIPKESVDGKTEKNTE